MFFFRTRWSRIFAELMSRKALHLYALGMEDVGALPDGGVLADVGCGHGAFLCMYLSHHPNVCGVGIDQSAELLRFARRKCTQAGVRALFYGADIHHLRLPENLFDVIVSHSSIYCWSDPVLVLDRLHQALKPGGRLLVYDELPARSLKEIRDALFVRRVYGLGIPAYTQGELAGFTGQSRFRGARIRSDGVIIRLEMNKPAEPGGSPR